MRHILFWALCLFSTFLLHGQQCAPVFPVPIPKNDSVVYTIEVFGLAHDDLSKTEQGLCEVRLNLLHSNIFDLEVWLTSPAGQTVQLIGPNITFPRSPLLGSTFDIGFERCAQKPGDPSYAQWDNQVIEFGFSTVEQFIPFQGCLQDFNQGSPNGKWQLKFKTFPSTSHPFPNILRNAELRFCDELGRHCCFADAGTFSNIPAPIQVCPGDSSLYFPDLAPVFAGSPPDTAYYDYTWVIGKDSVLFAYTDTLDLRSYPPGNYQISGFSYSRADTSSLPQPDGILRLDTLRAQLNSLTPPFCGELMPNWVSVGIFTASDTGRIEAIICRNTYYYVEGKPYYEEKKHIIHTTSVNGCDSVIVLDLRFRPPIYDTLRTTICDQDSLVISKNWVFRLPGTYTIPLQSDEGCDSLLTIELTVIPTPSDTITRYICQGGTYTLGGKVIKNPGTHPVRVPAPSGCDSLIILNLIALNPQVNIRTPETITCDRPQIVLNGSGSQPAGQLQYRWVGPGGALLGMDSLLSVSIPGAYQLRVQQEAPGGIICATQTTVFVGSDLAVPDVEVSGIDTLSCIRTSTLLSGRNKTTSTDVSFVWKEATRPLSPGDTTSSLLVRQAGLYSFIGRDRSSGCLDTAQIRIAADTLKPVVRVGTPQQLTCARTTVEIGDPNAPISGLRYVWSISDGSVAPVYNRPTLAVQRPSTWRLSVESLKNGCTATDSIRVTQDTIRPVALAGATRRLTCKQPIATLNGSSSSSGTRIAYSWEATQGGRLVAGGNTPNPQVDAAGMYILTVIDTTNRCTAQDSVRITAALENPEIPFIRDEILNCRDTLVYLRAQLPDARDYSYRWCGAQPTGQPQCQNDLVFLARTSGIYTFELTDVETGCTSTDQIQVTQDITPPLVEAGKTEIFRCNQTEIQLNGTTGLAAGRFKITWKAADGGRILSGERMLTPIVSGPGLYTMLVEDLQNACTASDTMRVVADTRFPTASAGKDTTLTCDVPTLRLKGATNLPSWGFECSWTTPNGRIVSDATKLNALIDRSGRYILMITDRSNGCSGRDTVEISQNQVSPTARIERSMQGFLLTCLNDTLLLDAAPATSGTGAPLTYSWRNLANGSFTPTSRPDQIRIHLPGIYHLVVRDQSNGCKDTLEIPVESDFAEPIIQIPPPDVLTCDQTSVDVMVKISSNEASVKFTWLDPDGNQLPGNPAQIIATQPGQYQVRVTNLKTGCTAQAYTNVRENRTPPDIIFAPVEPLDCDTRTVALNASASTGSGRLSFTWSTVEGAFNGVPKGPLAEGSLPGWYFLLVFNPENGCSALDSVRIDVRANAIDSVTYTITAPGCSPTLPGKLEIQRVFGGSPPYRFDLNRVPATAGRFDGLIPGTFTLNAVDSEGCTWSAEVEIPQPERISVDLGSDITLNEGDSVRLDARVFPTSSGLSFQWTGVEGLSGSSGDFQIVQPAHSTTYEVRVTAANQCTASDQVRVQVVQEVPVFIPNAFSPNGDGQNDAFFVQADPAYSTIQSMRVFDRTGALVFSREQFQANDPTLGWDGRLRNSDPKIGVYVYQVIILKPNGREVMLSGDVMLLR